MLRFIFLLLISPLVYGGVFTLGTTSTTTNSGLMDYLLPYFTKQTGHEVKVITGGTGFILQQLARKDVQVAITHQPELEKALLAKFPEGKRQPFMYNHFLIVGPKDDPAEVAKANSFNQAFSQIYAQKSLFISRGDNSGSHLFELSIWKNLQLTSDKKLCPCYLESGQDMGPTLNMASEKNAYTLVDEGTWLAYEKRSQLKPLYFGKTDGLNIYSVMRTQEIRYLSPAAAEFLTWLADKETLALINQFRINGQQGFYSLENISQAIK